MDAMLRLSYNRTMGLINNYCRFIPGKVSLKELGSDRVYIYESVVDGGCGLVVGYILPDEPMDISNGFIEQYFIEDFCRDVLKNEEYAKKFAEALTVPFEKYKAGAILDFALDDDAIEEIKATGDWPPFSMNKRRNEAAKVLNQLDEWLNSCGFLNNYLFPRYRYVTRVKKVEFFNSELPLSKFSDLQGHTLETPPKKISYVLRKEN